MARAPIGRRIRERRRDRQMTQTALAEAVGISPSYLNLIEHDKRLIGGALLGRIAAALGLQVGALSGVEDTRLAQDILEIARSLALGPADGDSAVDFVARCPDWARGFVKLHRAYRDAADTAMALGDRLSQDPALMDLTTPADRVTAHRPRTEFLEQHSILCRESAPVLAPFGSPVRSTIYLSVSAQRVLLILLAAAFGQANRPRRGNVWTTFIIHHGNHFRCLEESAGDAARHPFCPAAISTRSAASPV